MHIAIDIGGTKTLLALFTTRGTRVKRYKMKSYQDPDQWLSELKKNLRRILPLRRKTIQNIVISYPGVLNGNHPGKAVNLPQWDGKKIAAGVKQVFLDLGIDRKIYYKNDADLGGLYECWGYIGKTVYLTFGTGIGGALVRSHHLTRGSAEFEPGHMVKVYQGKRQEWEKIASSKAIRAANDDLDVTKLAEEKALDDVACRMAVGIAPIIKEYQPDQIVISGPIAQVLPGFHDTLMKLLRADLPKSMEVPEIYAAKRPQESVIYGAYRYGKSKLN
jgi:predicted NBD/HSP70 family sugar kinase